MAQLSSRGNEDGRHSMTANSRPWRTSQAFATAALALATVGNYALWLAWDQERDIDPVTMTETGPYEPWQVVGAAATLALLAFVAGWRQHPLLAIIVIPTVFTTCWAIDAATEVTPDANLWPIGAASLGGGTLVGTVLLGALGSIAHSVRDRISHSKNR